MNEAKSRPEDKSKATVSEVPTVFAVFNEIGIISQLSTTLFNRRLPNGIHVSHFSILNHLSKRDFDETPVMLADAFQVSKGTMTHSLQVLETRRYVELVPNPADGRSKIVRITPQGRQFCADAISALAPAIEELSNRVDMDRLAPLLPELRHLREVLDDSRDI